MSDQEASTVDSPLPVFSAEEGELSQRALMPNNGLMVKGPPEGMEDVMDYQYGGHHPVHLGDHLGKDGRYRVIHKLGYGGFALVWLCRDLESKMPKKSSGVRTDIKTRNTNIGKIIYVYLSISFESMAPMDRIFVLCIRFAGPPVSRVMRELGDPDKALRKISFQTVQVMALLHKFGVCHGEEDIIKILGKPSITKVMTYDGKDVSDPIAPKYLVRPVNFDKLDSQFVMDSIYVIDFGESFEAASGLTMDGLGTPGPYRSPELLLNNNSEEGAGVASDLWALGCTLFTIRTGRKLFDAFGGSDDDDDDDMDDYLYRMVLLLGILPEPWWSTTWETRKEFFRDEPDAHGRAVMTDVMRDEHERLDPPEDLSIEDALKRGLFYLSSDDHGRIGNIYRRIPDTEIRVFANLLKKILQLEPSKRLSAAEILEHEWFKL